jgi:hypothetical protein
MKVRLERKKFWKCHGVFSESYVSHISGNPKAFGNKKQNLTEVLELS